MPDWVAYVRAHLGDDNSREVVEELANHLEETYQCLWRQGVGREEALRMTEGQVENWRELREQILRAQEGEREKRVRRVGIPGLVTFFCAAVSLVIVGKLGVEPVAFLGAPVPPVVLYIPWLVALPVFGALGALLARRAKVQGLGVHISSTFPAILMGVAMVTTLMFVLFLWGRGQTGVTPGTFVAAAISWVAVPGLALSLGDVVFQRIYKRYAENR